MTAVACGPYTIHDAEILDDGSLRLVAERTYTVERSADAPTKLLQGALRWVRGTTTGELRFGNFIGEARLGPTRVNVVSERLPAGADARMLEQVAAQLSSLPFLAEQPVGHAYARDELSGPDVLYQSFLVLRHAMAGGPPHDLPAAVERILARPHERLVDEREDLPLAFASHLDGATLHEIASRPDRLLTLSPSHPLASRPTAIRLCGRLPTDIRTRRARPTSDTRENRFVAAVLEALVDVCRRVEASARIRKLAAHEVVTAEAAGYRRRLENWRRHPVLESLRPDPSIPAQSTVLQGRSGYRHLTWFWLDVIGRSRLMPPQVARGLIELRDAAALYEIWCYFEVIRLVAHHTGQAAVLESLKSDDVAASLQWRHLARVGTVTVHFNRTFPSSGGLGRPPGRSYSVRLRPDICIETASGRLHALDAKLKRNARAVIQRLSNDDSADPEEEEPPETQEVATFVRADLHKMHAYRDALGVGSVWVLYPGGAEGAVGFPSETGEDAVNGGVGAIPLLPGSSTAALSGVVERMLAT